jgi:hypothetical protein
MSLTPTEAEVLEPYPNLAQLIGAMNESTRTLAFMYLSLLPEPVIIQLDSNIPAIVSLNEQGDERGLYDLMRAFGADDETATALMNMRNEYATP